MTFLIIIVVIAVILMVLALSQPVAFRIERQVIFSYPAEQIFPELEDFHKWQGWSPWARMDPGARYGFSGENGQPGASTSWSGNGKVGAGKMTLMEVVPNEYLGILMEFQRPMKGVSTSEFVLEPDEEGTRVTWTMSGQNNFIARLMGVFADCDEIVGRQFISGFLNLDYVLDKKHG